MSTYQYANNPQTTLSGSVTAGATSISVTSAAAFPSQGRFTIIVDTEIMLVTGVAGTTWTVERGAESTTAASHTNNSTVTGILTVASFLNHRYFDVRAYGAKGDGTTDDTAAIQAAVNAAIAAGGGTVFLPIGTYIVTGIAGVGSDVTIQGDGWGTIVRYNGAADGDVIALRDGDNLVVQDLRVEDNAIAVRSLVALNWNRPTSQRGLAVRRVQGLNTNIDSNGIIIGYSDHPIVEECEIENTTIVTDPGGTDLVAAGIAVHSASPNETIGALVTKNRIRGYRRGIESYGTGERTGMEISHNYITDNISTSIFAYHASQGIVSHNQIEDGYEGIYSDVIDGVVDGNRVKNCSQRGIRFEQSQGSSAHGNVVTECGGDGVVIGGGCQNFAYTGGAVTLNAGSGIVIDRSTTAVTNQPYEILIGDVVVRHNTAYGIYAGGVYRTLKIEGCIVSDNGFNNGASTIAGIRVGTDPLGSRCGRVQITGCTIANNQNAPSGGGSAGDQKYGIRLDDAGAQHVSIIGCYMDGNVTNGIWHRGITIPQVVAIGNRLQTDNIVTAGIMEYTGNTTT